MRGFNFILAILLPMALAMPTYPSSVPIGEYCGGPATITVTCTAPFTVTITPTVTISAAAVTVTALLHSGIAATAIKSDSISPPIAHSTHSPVHYYSNSTVASHPRTTVKSSASSSTLAGTSQPIASSPPVPGLKSSASSSTLAGTSQPIASSPPVSGWKSKRGVIIPSDDPSNTASYVKAFGAKTPKISWTGNFYSGPPNGLSPDIEYVPQRYNVFASDNHDWAINANKAIAAGEKYLFSYGEPGLKSSNPMDAQTGANYWKEQLQPFTTNATVGAPCMGSMDYDFTWLEDFLGYCDTCDIGFIAVHWINTLSPGGAPSSAANFKSVVAHAVSIAKGKPVWIDNIRASGAHEDTVAFLSDIVPWLDQNDAVARYAYFGPGASDSSSLITSDGTLTALGSFYVNL